jgi:hypothetical protein
MRYTVTHGAKSLVDCKMGDILIYDENEESELIFTLLEDQKSGHKKSNCMILSGKIFNRGPGTILELSGIIIAAKPLFPNFSSLANPIGYS